MVSVIIQKVGMIYKSKWKRSIEGEIVKQEFKPRLREKRSIKTPTSIARLVVK